MVMIKKEELEALRREYPKGTRVELVMMEDAQSPPPGTIGTVQGVDDAGNILMRWSNGSSLSLVPEVDVVRKVKE